MVFAQYFWEHLSYVGTAAKCSHQKKIQIPTSESVAAVATASEAPATSAATATSATSTAEITSTAATTYEVSPAVMQQQHQQHLLQLVKQVHKYSSFSTICYLNCTGTSTAATPKLEATTPANNGKKQLQQVQIKRNTNSFSWTRCNSKQYSSNGRDSPNFW